jgi:predicted transcriptional regulator of viral defense system
MAERGIAMRLVDVLSRLLEMGQPVFETSDVAAYLDVERAHASQLMGRLMSSKHVVRLARGLWALRDGVDPLALPGYLTAPLPSYVSLYSALYHHGMLSQIPAVTYAVSLARTRRFETPLGTVSIHHIGPSFFFGFETLTTSGAKLASPEKAFLDFLYLGPAKTKLFRVVPELEIPPSFSVDRARRMIGQIPAGRRRRFVSDRFERLLRREGGLLSDSA